MAFPAAAEGQYTLSCYPGNSTLNFPVCCRSDQDGAVACRKALSSSLASWIDVSTPF